MQIKPRQRKAPDKFDISGIDKREGETKSWQYVIAASNDSARKNIHANVVKPKVIMIEIASRNEGKR